MGILDSPIQDLGQYPLEGGSGRMRWHRDSSSGSFADHPGSRFRWHEPFDPKMSIFWEWDFMGPHGSQGATGRWAGCET